MQEKCYLGTNPIATELNEVLNPPQAEYNSMTEREQDWADLTC